jgi:hypothetical protein
MPYKQGQVSVTTSPTLICSTVATSGNDGVLIQNLGTVAVFVGGANVATSGANAGISVAANAIVTIPTTGAANNSIFGISATTGQLVSFLFPS